MILGTTGDHGFITFSVKIVTDCSCLGTLKDPMKNTCKSLVTERKHERGSLLGWIWGNLARRAHAHKILGESRMIAPT